MVRLVEHKELRCPKCGGEVTKRAHSPLSNVPDYDCNKCGAELDLIW